MVENGGTVSITVAHTDKNNNNNNNNNKKRSQAL